MFLSLNPSFMNYAAHLATKGNMTSSRPNMPKPSKGPFAGEFAGSPHRVTSISPELFQTLPAHSHWEPLQTVVDPKLRVFLNASRGHGSFGSAVGLIGSQERGKRSNRLAKIWGFPPFGQRTIIHYHTKQSQGEGFGSDSGSVCLVPTTGAMHEHEIVRSLRCASLTYVTV